MVLSRKLRIGLILLAVVAVSVAAYGLTQRPATPAATFTTLDGRHIGLQGLQGKVIVVTFWATSCSICVEEMPDLVETYRQYHSRGFELIAVAMAYDSSDEVKNFVRDSELPFPVVFDSTGALARSFNDTTVVPTMFVIDRSGKLVSSTLGAIDFSKLRHYLDVSLGI